MNESDRLLDNKACRIARLTKDPRFDGLFYIGVKTTGIYCRSTCPATPNENNVEYFASAFLAIKEGYRPCLRCHPDSAPGISVTQTKHDELYNQCIRIFEEDDLEELSLQTVCKKLGISTRHLRNIFIEKTGVPPKYYLMLQRTLFAKKLLHQTSLSITNIAFSSGFRSIRRFNDHFKKHLGLCPSSIRRRKKKSEIITLKLSFRPPYDWENIKKHYQNRLVKGLEWIGKNSYGRTFSQNGIHGEFTAEYKENDHCFVVDISVDDLSLLRKIVCNIRRILDLDTDIKSIKSHYNSGLHNAGLSGTARIPGRWNVLEAGIRAIIEHSADSATINSVLKEFVYAIGKSNDKDRVYFPTAEQILLEDLSKLQNISGFKNEIISYSKACKDSSSTFSLVQQYRNNKIKNETISVAEIYGLGNPDVCLDHMEIIRQFSQQKKINNAYFAPYRSYYYQQIYSLLVLERHEAKNT